VLSQRFGCQLNVLVSDKHVMEIADFSLARNVQKTDCYKKLAESKLPIKWIAPELLIARKYRCTKNDLRV